MEPVPPRTRCAFCLFPEDVAKLKTKAACCTGCCDDCVCLDRIWYGTGRAGKHKKPRGTR